MLKTYIEIEQEKKAIVRNLVLSMVLGLVGSILLVLLLVHSVKMSNRAYENCIERGYDENYCTYLTR